MKKFMITLGAFMLTASMIPSMQVEAKETFTDLEGIGAKNDIMYLYEKNIIGGYEDGTFKPNQPITRAQVSSMLVKALDYDLIENPTVNFKDVTNRSSYYKIMATVNEKGILRGDNGYMRPNDPTTRGQMSAILRRSFDLPLEKQATFIDVSPLNGFSSDINSIAKNRITGGYPDGTFKPANSVTRAQFSSFLVRAMDDEMKVSSYKSYISQKGTEIEQDGWLFTIKGGKLLKINQKSKEEVVLLSRENIPNNDSFEARLSDGFPIIIYNNELFIPYWSGIGEATELPYSYGLMKTTTDGKEYREVDLQGRKFNSGVNRNVYVWNDRIYYTALQTYSEPSPAFDETVNIDAPLYFYSVKLDGSDPKVEATIDARVIFEETPNAFVKKPVISQNNKSVKYDHSAMYYFNKKGVFKYNLLNRKTTRLSSVQAKDMKVTDTGITIVDVKGKSHILKK